MSTAGTTPTLFAMPQWYGLPGERYKTQLRLISQRENEVTKIYHRQFSFNFIDAGGNRFLLYTDTEPKSGNDEPLKCNTEYSVAFTVKEHRKRHITRIERCTFREISHES
jgi:hypothetical protein